MQNLPPIIHIGYPKTGTTWFQQKFYPTIENVRFISREELIENLINIDVFSFNPSTARGIFEQLSDGKVMIICEELLVGGLDIGFGIGEFIKEVANRIKKTFPEGEIVIFIRNQEQMILSAYSQYIKAGGTFSLSSYVNSQTRFKAFFKNHHLFNLKFFEYDRIIELYVSLFGRDKVHIFLYEDFAINPEQFIDNYCSEMGIEKNSISNMSMVMNPRLSNISMFIFRLLNHFTRKNTVYKKYYFNLNKLYFYTLSLIRFIDQIKITKRKKQQKLPPPLKNRIQDYYKASNNRLTRYISINRLNQFKYPL